MTRTNELTKIIIQHMNLTGFHCWRQNNGAVFNRKRDAFMKNPAHKLGIPDIIGFRKSDGKFLGIEIKTGKDKLSVHQEIFLAEAKTSGAICFVVNDSFKDFEKKIALHNV